LKARQVREAAARMPNQVGAHLQQHTVAFALGHPG
jgi:hypothetical protein